MTLLLKGSPEYRTLSLSEWKARRPSSGCMNGRGQKAQAIFGEGETIIPRSLSAEWRPEGLDAVNERKAKGPGHYQAKRPSSRSVKRTPEGLGHCQWKGGQNAWTLSMKGRPKVLDSISKGEARKPRSLSGERRPGVVCEMRPEGQALSVR